MKYLILALCLSFSAFAQESFSPIEGRFPEDIKDRDSKDKIQEERERVKSNKKANDFVRGENADPQLNLPEDEDSKEGAVD